MLTDGTDVFVITCDGLEYISFHLVTRGVFARRKFKMGTELEYIKAYLTEWLQHQYNIDFERFHTWDKHS